MAAGGVYSRAPSLTDIPQFVSAQTPMGLRRAMFKNNLKLKAFVNYQHIQYANGKWFAWFFLGVDQAEQVGEDSLSGITDNE